TRPAICDSDAFEATRLQPDCDPHPGAGNRGDFGGVQLDSGSAADAAALQEAATTDACAARTDRRAKRGKPTRLSLPTMVGMAEGREVVCGNRRLFLAV